MIRALLFVLFLICLATLAHGQEYTLDTAYTDDGTFDTYEQPSEETEDYESDYETDYNTDDEDEATFTQLEPQVVPGSQRYREEKIPVRKFDRQQWKNVIGDTDYREKKKEPEPEAEQEEAESETNPISEESSPWKGDVFRFISYAIIVGVALFILYLVFKNITFTGKFKKETVITDDSTGLVDNIQDLNVQSLLQQALAAGNFRLAVRLYYLDLLKNLDESGIIVWKKDKTNRDYLSEVFSRNYHYDDVRKLTLAYELVWYGEHTLTKNSFQNLINRFENIQLKFNPSKTGE